MKKLLFLGACLVALGSSPVLAQSGGLEVVVVRVVEVHQGGRLHIITTHGEGKSEEVTLKRQTLGGQVGIAEASQKAIAKLYAEGYTLKTTYGGGDHITSYTTLIFTKGQ